MTSRKIYPALAVVLLVLSCQFTNTFMSPAATATPLRAPTRTRTAAPTLPPPPTVAVVPPAPTSAPAPVMGIAKDNLRVRDAPSTSGAIIGRLNMGDQAQVVARNPAGDWLQINLPTNPNDRGWVSAAFMTVSVPVDTIPIFGAPFIPGPGPGPLPTAKPPRPYP